MPRVLHIGDIHIKDDWRFPDTRQVMGQVLDIIRQESVDHIVIPGDVFDGSSTPFERSFFKMWLDDTFDSITGSIVIVKGNHDKDKDLMVYSGHRGTKRFIAVIEEMAIVEMDNLVVVGLPWPRHTDDVEKGNAALSAVFSNLDAAMEQYRGRPCILAAHLQVGGARASSGQPLIGASVEATLGDLQELISRGIVKHIALNHIHKPQKLSDNIVYAGSITCRDHGEEGERKCVVLIDMEPGGPAEYRTIPLDCWRWVTVDAVVKDGEVSWSLASEFADGKVVRFRYRCKEEEAHLFDHAEIKKTYQNAVRLKIVPEIERAERVRSEAIVEARTNLDKLKAWGASVGVEITDDVVKALRDIEGVAL